MVMLCKAQHCTDGATIGLPYHHRMLTTVSHIGGYVSGCSMGVTGRVVLTPAWRRLTVYLPKCAQTQVTQAAVAPVGLGDSSVRRATHCGLSVNNRFVYHALTNLSVARAGPNMLYCRYQLSMLLNLF